MLCSMSPISVPNYKCALKVSEIALSINALLAMHLDAVRDTPMLKASSEHCSLGSLCFIPKTPSLAAAKVLTVQFKMGVANMAFVLIKSLATCVLGGCYGTH